MARARDIDNSKWRLSDMMQTAAMEIAPPDADVEAITCLYCCRQLGVCECIPAERAILNDEFNVIIIDAEFEEVS